MRDPKKVINYIQLTGALTKAATARIAELEAAVREKQAAARAPEAAVEKAADALIKAGHFGPEKRPAVLRTLRDPALALEFVGRLAAIKAAAPAAIGEPVPGEKQAAAGAAVTKPGRKASDEAFESGMRRIAASK